MGFIPHYSTVIGSTKTTVRCPRLGCAPSGYYTENRYGKQHSEEDGCIGRRNAQKYVLANQTVCQRNTHTAKENNARSFITKHLWCLFQITDNFDHKDKPLSELISLQLFLLACQYILQSCWTFGMI